MEIDFQQLLDAGSAIGTPKTVTGREPVVLVPNGYSVRDLTPAKLLELPDHIRQTITVKDAESFNQYVTRFKTAETTIFSDPGNQNGDGAQFTAIIDYHHTGTKGEDLKHNRCAHRVIYPLPLSIEWMTWMRLNATWLKQTEFIDFIDANTPDIIAPATADLLELAMNFESKTDVQFTSKVDRTTGGRVLNYSEDVKAGGNANKIKVPDKLTINVAVFEGGAAYSLDARIEWSPKDGKLSVRYVLFRPHDVIRQAVKDIRQEIAGATDIEPLTGSPTSQNLW